MSSRVVLDRTPPAPAVAPLLDDAQQQVVDHRGGPLLVLAGPGTGKTTTVVEAVASRLSPGPDALTPDQVLVLTFGRRAAGELRDRVVARLGGGVVPAVSTFHSYAYALVRACQDPQQFADPVRLLSGPEQEARLREILRFGVDTGRVPWPSDLRAAVGTRGLAAEVRAVVAALRSQGLDPDQLAEFGRRAGNPAWAAVGAFADEYLTVLDAEGVLDYTELLLRAVIAAERPEVSRRLRSTYRAVFVDEYQDTDPLQVRLLQALVTPATSLVVVGDPDQAIYSFRGADVGGLLRFRDTFRTPAGLPADLVVLNRGRRFGPAIRRAATAVLGPRIPAGISAADMRRHRNPASDGTPYGDGLVQVHTCDDEGAQAAHVAEIVRRAVLTARRDEAEAEQAPDAAAGPPPLGWSDVAVLVRSGAAIPALARALLNAGVPVEVAGDEVPVRSEPAVAPLLAAARVVADPHRLTPDVAQELLLAPLAGLDPADLRRLGRALRAAERVQGAEAGVRPRPSMELVAEAVRDPRLLLGVDQRQVREGAAAVTGLSQLLDRARGAMNAGGTPHDVLWALWSGTPWPARLRATALAGGPGARRAHRDLDAVCALFDIAERGVQHFRGVLGLDTLLDEVERHAVPGEAQAERGARGQSVRILTAHRSKGLEWRLVVVPGVQEGSWPDLRRRGSVLQADRIGTGGLVDPPTAAAVLAEERRLFYVACTRARERLVVTAVAGRDDDAPEPSRFVTDLRVPVVPLPGRPARPLSVPALVAELRRASVDPDVPPQRREAAAVRLARLAALRDRDGRRRVPAAHPDSWWGLAPLTRNEHPVRDPQGPVRLSGSAVESLLSCPLKWFLGREAHADTPRGTATGFGSLVHVLADRVARGQLPPDLEVLDAALGGVWGQLGFEASWQSARERVEARAALARFLVWHEARSSTLVASERVFEVVVRVPGADGHEHEVLLRGSIDVVDAQVVDGRAEVQVHDLKTGRTPPTAAAVGQHAQLGVYQSVVSAGAVDDIAREVLGIGPAVPVVAAGADLVQLRTPASAGAPGPKVQLQPAPASADPGRADGPTWIDLLIGQAADALTGEVFVPTPGAQCRYCEFALVCPAQPQGRGVLP